jgi:hypothetical protein
VTDDTGDAATPGDAWTPAFLAAIRSRPRWRAVGLVVAALVGLGAAWVHWLGLFVAGVLVGLPSRTLREAVIAGGVLGVVVVVVQILVVPAMDAGEFLALRLPVYVTLGAGIGAPLWGSLVRGVV